MSKIIKTNVVGIGDPFIVLEKDTYYLYTTGDGGKPFHVHTSRDGKVFEDKGVCLGDENQTLTSDFWAPEVIKYQNEFYMIYSGRSPLDKAMHIQIAKSKTPLGPFINLKEEPIVNIVGKSTIDGHCFIEDGQVYLFFALDCSTNIVNGVHTSQIYVVKLSNDLMNTVGDYQFISTPTSDFELKSGDYWQWNEGPYLLKNNHKYYLTYSTNHYESKYYCVGCLVADHIMGPYRKLVARPVLEYIENEISGPGHNSFFIDKDGQLKCVFHIHTFYEMPSANRMACICNAYFDEQGILIIDYK